MRNALRNRAVIRGCNRVIGGWLVQMGMDGIQRKIRIFGQWTYRIVLATSIRAAASKLNCISCPDAGYADRIASWIRSTHT